MDTEPTIEHEREALRALGWDARRLFVESFAYGFVGVEADIREHLVTGDHLGPAQVAVVHATLHEALTDVGEPSPFGAREATET